MPSLDAPAESHPLEGISPGVLRRVAEAIEKDFPASPPPALPEDEQRYLREIQQHVAVNRVVGYLRSHAANSETI